jgi:hypothetical protein
MVKNLKLRVSDLSEEQVKMIQDAAQKTWSTIAADVYELCDGRPSQSEVIEFILDADRIAMYGCQEAQDLLHKMSWAQQKKLMKTLTQNWV